MNKKVWGSVAGVVVLLGVATAGLNQHQATHFNRNVTINGVKVGGLTAKQAFNKVQQSSSSQDVYFDGQQIYAGHSVKVGLTNADQSKFKQALAKQKTLIPTSKAENFAIQGTNFDTSQLEAMQAAVQQAVSTYNQGKSASVDAHAELVNGQIKVIKSVQGTALDEQAMLKQFNNRRFNPTIKLTKQVQTPVKADSQTIKTQKQHLEALNKRHVVLKIQDHEVKLGAKDLVTKATYLHGTYQIDTAKAQQAVTKLNHQYATLGKAIKFKTHSGQEITLNNQGTYGWALSAHKLKPALQAAFAKDSSKVINAKDYIYGIGYNENGTGYNNTTNNGIGNTYVEVSKAAQHVWWYRDGKVVFEADVVTGTEQGDNATPTGVYYTLYKQRGATLRGLNDDGSKYSSPVAYWVPFTQQGHGFHDASWRGDWSKTAYLAGGSHGCVNMKVGDAGTAFASMDEGEPVVIY